MVLPLNHSKLFNAWNELRITGMSSPHATGTVLGPAVLSFPWFWRARGFPGPRLPPTLQRVARLASYAGSLSLSLPFSLVTGTHTHRHSLCLSMHMFGLYTHTLVYTHIQFLYVCTHVYARMHACIHGYMSRLFVCESVCLPACLPACLPVCLYVCICVCVCMYVCMYV